MLIHGDAAFPGQGVVAETLNLSNLAGYSTGGTLHLITNNQVGFTTDPTEGRSTRYSSDLAKGFDLPIIHVNADDPEAALSRGAPRARLPGRVRPRRRHRHRRLPALRPQRAGRAGVHAAADGRADPAAADGARAVRARGSSTEGVLPASERTPSRRTPSARSAPPTSGSRQRSPSRTHRRAPPADDARGATGEAVFTAVRPSGSAPRRAAAACRPGSGQPEARPPARAAARGAREAASTGGRPKRSRSPRCSRRASRSGSPGQDTERGTFSHRHLVSTTPTRARPTRRSSISRCECVVRGLQLAALRVRGARLRIRLLDRGARRPRALGGAVRRLRQRRADRRRPVHRRRPFEVGPDVALDAPAAAWLRRERPGALERQARAVPAARGTGEHPRRELHDCGAVLPSPATPGARRDGAPARRHDAERPARLRRRPPRSTSSPPARSSPCSTIPGADHAASRARALLREDVLRHRRTRGTRRRAGVAVARVEQLYPFPSKRRGAVASTRGSPIVWAQEEPQNMGPWRSIRHRLEEVCTAGVRSRGTCRPALAREPERGLPDRSPARAGQNRARSAGRSGGDPRSSLGSDAVQTGGRRAASTRRDACAAFGPPSGRVSVPPRAGAGAGAAAAEATPCRARRPWSRGSSARGARATSSHTCQGRRVVRAARAPSRVRVENGVEPQP